MSSTRRPSAVQRLSRTDSGFVAAETPEWHMNVGVLAVFDADAGTALGTDQLRRLVGERLAQLGLFRRRIVEMPGRLDRPEWEDAPELDVDAHLRHATADPPGDERELDRLVGEIFGRPLDRSRPLWELWRLDGLRDGGVALLLKIHHACIDGVYAAEFASVIFDLEPDAPVSRPDIDVDARPRPTLARSPRASCATLSVATTPLRAAHVVVDVARATTGARPVRPLTRAAVLGATVPGTRRPVQRVARPPAAGSCSARCPAPTSTRCAGRSGSP